MPPDTTDLNFDAKEVLQQTLQGVDLRDNPESLIICRLFRLPVPLSMLQDANDKEVCMPGAYIFSRMPEPPPIIPITVVRRTLSRQPIIQRLLGFIFSPKRLEQPSETEKFPNEVLKKIFVFAHVNELLLHGPITLINVSKQWRALAFAVPVLWDNLHITYGSPTNPFYTLTYHACHAQDLRLCVNSPAVLAALTTLNAVIPPSIRPKVLLAQLNTITLLGFGAIEAIDSFPFHYPSLTKLTLIDIRRLFPLNLIANCPALEKLIINFSVESIHETFLNEDLPHCPIICTFLDIVWSSKWVQFNTTYGDTLSIFRLTSFIYSLADRNEFPYCVLPFGLLYKNPNIENLVLRRVSFAYMNIDSISNSEEPGSYSPLTDLSRLTRLELSDVDEATTLFQLCVKFPALYFPRLTSLYLFHMTLDVEVLMAYIHMKIGTSGAIPSSVSRLRVLTLEGILFGEECLTELRSMNTLGRLIVDVSS